MKISILSPHLKIAGGVMVLVNYAHYLSLRGHEVTVLAVNPVGWRRGLANFLKQKPAWMRDMKFKIKRIPALEEKYFPGADILLVTAAQQAGKIEKFSERAGKKVNLVQHDERLYHGDPGEVALAYSLPHRYIAVSTWVKETLERDFNQAAELLLNPIDRNVFHPYGDAAENRGGTRVLMLHHTYAWKGTEEGIKIFNELKEKYPDIKLVMYGARQNEVACDEYYFKPVGRETAKIFSGCDIFLCPSWDEGFGLPSIEAMACRCALATYDNGGSRDYAFDGQTALVARRRDTAELKNKLEMLVKDAGLRKKIADSGYQFMQKWPTWEEQTEKLEQILKELI